MRQNTAVRRARLLQIGAPAAVIGTLAGTLAAVPASADSVPVARLHLAPARVAPTTAPPTGYIVQPGDTVYGIAVRHGLATADVLAWNGLTSRSVIYPGQSLTLSGAAAIASAPEQASSSHLVAAGDTVFGIAQKYGTTVDAILAANGLTRASIIYPGQTLAVSGSAPAPVATAAPAPVPVATAQTHVVAAGDTLFGIAQKYGTTTATLLGLNGLAAGAIIYPGQSIVVSAPPAPAASTVPAQLTATLDAEQAGIASVIISIGRQLGVPEHGIAIALATAMVESGMRNLDWGDRDSLGVFQQRPSTGWGTPEQVRDVDRSTRVFYGGQSDPNGQVTRGLLDIAGWEALPFTAAAQAVQISAYPDRYGQWETQAHQWLALYG